MSSEEDFARYFNHLKTIRWRGRVYKRFLSSPVAYLHARRFGRRIVEVGCGTGNGLLGTFPSRVVGLDVNPYAVDDCVSRGLDARLIRPDGFFPLAEASFDSCVLDNVLEHIEEPGQTLDECWRITSQHGGMVIGVPGIHGYATDPDHKVFYDEDGLRNLDTRWSLVHLYGFPSIFRSSTLSRSFRQYGLLAVYRKKPPR